MIQISDNFNSINYKEIKYIELIGNKTDVNSNKKVINDKLEIYLKDFQNLPSNTFFSFFKDEEKRDIKNQDDLIISIKKDAESYQAQTGNYVGKFVWDGLEVNIKSRFSDVFLERMLNFVNDIFLDDVSVAGKETKDLDISKYIIYYMFVQNLEKAFLLGFPKSYKSIKHHEMKLKGKIDINRFIKYDIPFQGKLSSVSREQKEIQEIIDMLYKAITIIEKNKFSVKNISHIKTHLKQHRSNKYVSNETITKAIKSKALQNPIFSLYKKVLEYAKLIINANNLEEKKDAKKETFGFLVNVAELFEIYLVKLLRFRMPDWDVIHEEELELYKGNFYTRKMKPDFVMKHRTTNEVMVFDAKYKRMLFRSKDNYGMGDLDRSDFFQINTYMTYYNNQSDGKLIAGGLLYPIEKEFDCRFNDEDCEKSYDNKKAHSDNWFGNSEIKFIVDGIDLSSMELDVDEKMNEEEKSKIRMHNILKAEQEFICRIEKISGDR